MSLILTSFSWTYALLQVPGRLARGTLRATAHAVLGQRAVVRADRRDAARLLLDVLRRHPRVARRRAGGGLAKSPSSPSAAGSRARARQGQLHPARRPVSRPDRRGAAHHLGHPAFGWRGRSTASARWAWCSASRGGRASATTRPNTRASRRKKRRIIAAGQTRDGAGSRWRVPALPRLETQFWAIGVQYFFLVMIQSFYTTWLPTYLVNDRNLR